MADANAMQFSSMPVHRQSGLSLYPFRAYDPSLQRWLNRDPIGERGGINLYGFARNNPLAWIDPLGLDNQNPTQEEINANSINNGPVNIVLTLTAIMQPTPPVLSAEGSSVVRQPEEVPTGRYVLSSEYGGDDPLIQYALWAGGNAAALLATEFLGEAAPGWLSKMLKAKCPPKGPSMVDPSKLRLPASRAEGADPFKLANQIKQNGQSTEGMSPIEITVGKDGEMMINDGVTRATRAAMTPGTQVPVQVIESNPGLNLGNLPTVGQRLPGSP
jgi:RHS repeat-associated protein